MGALVGERYSTVGKGIPEWETVKVGLPGQLPRKKHRIAKVGKDFLKVGGIEFDGREAAADTGV